MCIHIICNTEVDVNTQMKQCTVQYPPNMRAQGTVDQQPRKEMHQAPQLKEAMHRHSRTWD